MIFRSLIYETLIKKSHRGKRVAKRHKKSIDFGPVSFKPEN